ncbi:MAG: metallophosphoesterase, partial [Pseudomonadota bacterium]
MNWVRVWVFALAAVLLPAAAPAPHAPTHPRPHPRIVAIGDLHGDFAVWRAIARAARVIDDRGHWAGGKTILVQTGDVPDRGPGTRRILDDLIRLQKEARAAGGRVVALI